MLFIFFKQSRHRLLYHFAVVVAVVVVVRIRVNTSYLQTKTTNIAQPWRRITSCGSKSMNSLASSCVGQFGLVVSRREPVWPGGKPT